MNKYKLHLRDIRSIQVRASTLELSADARKRLRWFNYYLTHDCDIGLTCRYYGIARSTFVRWAQRFSANDIRTLEELSRSPHSTRSKETPIFVVGILRKLRVENPYIPRDELSQVLKKEYGVEISTATIGRIIQDQGLFFGKTNSHKQKRKEWLASHSAESGFHTYNNTDPEQSSGNSSFQFSPA